MIGYYHGDLDDFDWDDKEEITKVDGVTNSEKENIKKDPKNDFLPCNRCGIFFYMAEPSESDGTFRCRACKFDPYR